jgi:hypothetical protein
MPIKTIQLAKHSDVFPTIFESWKYGLESEELAGNQIELIGSMDKINHVLRKFPATIIHKEHHKVLGRGEV